MVFLRTKFRDPVVLRKMLQEGHRWTPQELLAEGMVDELVDGGSEVVLRQALAMADRQSEYAKTGVYGLIKVIPSSIVFISNYFSVEGGHTYFFFFSEGDVSRYFGSCEAGSAAHLCQRGLGVCPWSALKK